MVINDDGHLNQRRIDAAISHVRIAHQRNKANMRQVALAEAREQTPQGAEA